MPQYAPINYGNVLAQGENIRGARTRNALAQQQLDPQSTRNQLQREQLTGARQGNVLAQQRGEREQTTFDQGQRKANTEFAYEAFTVMSENPSAVSYYGPKLKEMGIIPADADYSNATPKQTQAFSLKQSQALGKALGKTSKDQGFTLSQGQRRFGAGGEEIAAVAPKAEAPKTVETTQQKETIKSNVKRLSELSQTQRQRNLAVEKAKKFLRAFESGDMSSGSFQAMKSYLPGVFTDQGQFNEELDSFAEVAARQKLKASGEIRPTDADVKGMKKAMFGIGRDEQTNINLIRQFISEMSGTEDELNALRGAKEGGTMSSFAGGQEIVTDLPRGTVDNGDGTFTLPSGQRIRKSNANP